MLLCLVRFVSQCTSQHPELIRSETGGKGCPRTRQRMVRSLATRTFISFCRTKKLSLLQDFITDPVNPNLDGLFENVMQSCKVVIDKNGN